MFKFFSFVIMTSLISFSVLSWNFDDDEISNSSSSSSDDPSIDQLLYALALKTGCFKHLRNSDELWLRAVVNFNQDYQEYGLPSVKAKLSSLELVNICYQGFFEHYILDATKDLSQGNLLLALAAGTGPYAEIAVGEYQWRALVARFNDKHGYPLKKTITLALRALRNPEHIYFFKQYIVAAEVMHPDNLVQSLVQGSWPFNHLNSKPAYHEAVENFNRNYGKPSPEALKNAVKNEPREIRDLFFKNIHCKYRVTKTVRSKNRVFNTIPRDRKIVVNVCSKENVDPNHMITYHEDVTSEHVRQWEIQMAKGNLKRLTR